MEKGAECQRRLESSLLNSKLIVIDHTNEAILG
jgi:hypothetical protein